MQTKSVVRSIVGSLFGVSLIALTATAAHADNALAEPPHGAGTETSPSGPVGSDDRVHEGTQIAAFVGGGYGVGIGGRVGYAFRPGIYAGGALTYFSGNATFIGAELGYKLFVTPRWELEPYVFTGPAFLRRGDTGFGRADPVTVWAVQPGFLTAYHFGPMFFSAELRAYVTPSPGAFAALGGVGVAI